MADANAGQRVYWNGPVAETWAREQEKRDRDHEAVTKALIAWAAPDVSEQVLDVGCGSGTTTMLIAERVGASGGVTGIDISKPMLDVAQARAKQMKSRAVFLEADASDHGFAPKSFDLVFSQFGVMFFADPVAAFANLRRALKPGGRIAFCCWRSYAELPWAHVPENAARPFLPPSKPTDPNAPGRYAFADPARVRNLLLEAGFRTPQLQKFDVAVLIGQTPQEAAAWAIDSGPLMRTLAEADEDTRIKVRAAVEARLAEEMGEGGIFLTQAAWLVRAHA
jgi:SAM-dependent methyltransferase